MLPFKHLLTKLVLEFDNQSGSEITGVEIRGSKTTATIDIAGMKATAAESAGVEAIKPFTVKAGTTYSAIVVPQNGEITKENAATYEGAQGWSFVFSGTRMKALTTKTGEYQKSTIAAADVSDASWVGKTSINYYASSTQYQMNDAGTMHQFFALATTFTKNYPDGRLSAMYAHKECGVALRCIKNK